MVKTEFMELYEELSDINENLQEDIDPIASRKFWAAAKNKKMDEESFHAAFDADLAELGLMDVFAEDGRLTGRNVYGKIKAAKDANPDNWAVIALNKLWALRYVDNILFASEEAERAAAIEADKKRREEEEAEKARLAKERAKEKREALTREFQALLPAALKLVDKDLLTKFMDAYNITEADINVEVRENFIRDVLIVLPELGWGYDVIKDSVKDKTAELADILDSHFKAALKKVEADRVAKKLESNKAIDVFNSNQGKSNTSCRAILLGESGKLYQLTSDGVSYSTANLPGDVAEIKYLEDATEPYKVIYTSVSESETNYSTRSDSVSYTYYSWDSSEAALLKGLIPVIGKSEGTWSHTEVVSVDSGNSRDYSTMDNIDSWARERYTSYATD